MKKILLVAASALTHLFALPGTAQAANVYCTGTITGVIDGNVIVPEGSGCIALDAVITGFVRVEKGALAFHAHRTTIGRDVRSPQVIAFDIRLLDSEVGGNVYIARTLPGTVGAICGSTIAGDVHWVQNQGGQKIGAPFGGVCFTGNEIGGDVVLNNNSSPAINFHLDHNQIGGNVQVLSNTGSEAIFNNNIEGILNCQNNAPPPVSVANTAREFNGECGA